MYIYIYIYICIYTHTHTHMYIHTATHCLTLVRVSSPQCTFAINAPPPCSPRRSATQPHQNNMLWRRRLHLRVYSKRV